MPIVGPNSIIPCQPVVNGGLFPCKESLDYSMGTFNPLTGEWSNLVSGGDAATVVNSNAAYFNGTSSKIVCTYDNDILYYLDNNPIYYSLDGETALLWQTGDAPIIGLMKIDLAAKTITWGFDGTNYFTGWIWLTEMQSTIEGELVNFQNFTFASGLTVEEENRSVNENDWVGYLVPMWAEQFQDTELIDLYL